MTYQVPGSEKFTWKPIDPAALRQKLEPFVKMHAIDRSAYDAVDALTYEVVRHRLWAITDEMGEALKRMSGSMVVTDCNDFGLGIMDEMGDLVQVGLYNMQLCASMDMAVKWTMENRADNPGIGEGDMFLCNDPWVGGGLHQNDVSLFAPLFWEGELFGWTTAVAHQIDLGGVSPGSWTPRSENVFWESLPTPPVKIVEGHRLRADIEDLYLRRSRVPKLVALDLRAQIGANNLAQERLRSLIGKYGPTTVKAVMKRMMDDAEHRLRGKLRELPDGEWNAVAYQDQSMMGDRDIHKIVLKMTKAGEKLVFDFTGTDPQSGMINCTLAGTRAGVVTAILPMLCGDIPWSTGGIHRCVEIISEPGTMNNCLFPAGIGKASVGSAWATQNAATETLAGLLDTSPTYRNRAMSVCCGGWDLALIAGVDQRNNPFVNMMCDAMAGGMGARTDMDGIDTGGIGCIPMGRIADVEMTEFAFPILYLWRKEEPDSGGPGRYRGGVGASLCMVAHDTPLDRIQMVFAGGGKALPQSSGLAGGYPGSTMHDVIIRGSDVRARFAAGHIPGSLEEIKGETIVVQPEDEGHLEPGDAFYMHWQSGGGYGDPLRRDPQAVAYDLEEGKVSAHAARTIYGVLVDPTGVVDQPATEKQRHKLRHARAEMAAGE